MLVEFESKGYPTITMLGEIARDLLKMMGMSGRIPGAIKGRDVGDARRELRAALDAAAPAPDDVVSGSNDDNPQPPVSLATRAFPLLEMMAVASDNGYDVMWKERN
jgi:hypothetical protein